MEDTNALQKVTKQLLTLSGEQEEVKISKKMQVVVFEMNHEEFAIDILELQEIIQAGEITPIPNSPSYITGLFNLRGKIVVVIDLESRLHLEREKEQVHRHILVSEVEQSYFGISVDVVKEILVIDVDAIQQTPEVLQKKIHAGYLKGIIVLEKDAEDNSLHKTEETSDTENDSRLIVLIDLKKLLSEKEFVEFGGTIQAVSKEQNNPT